MVKETEWKRNCPKCGKEIKYVNVYNYRYAILKNTKCKTCTGKINGKNNTGLKRSIDTKEKIIKSLKLISEKRKTGKYSKCKFCGKEIYIPKREEKSKKYCSKKCYDESQKGIKIHIECYNDFCNNIMMKLNHEIKGKDKMFCSVRCANIYRSQLASKSRKYKNTKPEIKFKSVLSENNIKYIHQYPVQWKRGWKKWYDFYLEDYNLLIEVDGVYWHGKGKKQNELTDAQKHNKLNDDTKNILAKEHGYNLIRVWEDEINNFNINEIYEYRK